MVGLLDHGDTTSRYCVNLLGHKVGLQTSLVNRFCSETKPVYFAMLWPISSPDRTHILPKWQLHIKTIKPENNRYPTATLLQAYTTALCSWIERAPWAWQGFQWLRFFPAWDRPTHKES